MNSVQSVVQASAQIELFLLIALAVGVLFYGLTLGRERIAAMLVSTYIALAMLALLPVEMLLQSLRAGWVETWGLLILFLGAWLLSLWTLSRQKWFTQTEKGAISAQVIALSIAQLGSFFLALLLHAPQGVTDTLPALLQTIFFTDLGLWVWLLAPLAILWIKRSDVVA